MSVSTPAAPSRVPPHSVEAEESLLSCCFIDGRDVISRCLEAKLSDASFFIPAHAIVFGCMMDLYNRTPAIAAFDVSVIAEELKTKGQLAAVDSYAGLTRISGRVPTTAQASYFIQKVRELHLLREIIAAGTRAVEDCYAFSGGIDSFVDTIETNFFKVTQRRTSDRVHSLAEPMTSAMAIVRKMAEGKGALTGIASGFRELDGLMFGFQRSDMIVLAARPSMGKTALALNFVEAAVMPAAGPPAAAVVFSLEMSAPQLALRLLCSRARINLKLLRDGLISKHGEEMARIAAAAAEIERAPLFIDDSSALSIMQLRAKARRLAARHKLGFIVVDYLQLLAPSDAKTPREQQVAEASRGLKQLAKELDVPVLVLSQLNRGPEKENRTPRLADLRESGAIEQDADVVLMLARPKEAEERFQVAADTAELIVAKQRSGPVGEIPLTFFREFTRFESARP